MTEESWLGTQKLHVIHSHLLAKPHSQAGKISLLTALLGEVIMKAQQHKYAFAYLRFLKCTFFFSFLLLLLFFKDINLCKQELLSF